MEVKVDSDQEILIEKKEKQGEEVHYRKYLKGKIIGRGGFAICHEGTDLENNNKVAIKVIDKKSLSRNRTKQKLLSQIKIHKMLTHPYIVSFLTVFEDMRKVYIITELCQNKSLSQFVKRRKRLSAMEVKRFMLQLIDAMEYLHSLRVIHRDLKMANIFLNEKMETKVGDFGLAAKLEFHDERKRTMCGTPNYIAPEIIQGGVGHSYEVDVWSAGVICYAMMIGRPPFEATEIAKTYQKIKNGLFTFPEIDGLTNDFKDFVLRTLVIDPKKRLTLKQMRDHSFLREKFPDITYNKITLTPVYDSLLNTCRTLLPQDGINFTDQKWKKSKYSTISTLKNQNLKENVRNPDQKTENVEWVNNGIVCNVDYSTKYGLGYILSNGTVGVYFNDGTLLYRDSNNTFYYYLENPSLSQEQIQKFTREQVENNTKLYKKYLLMKKFKIYLDDQLISSKTEPCIQNPNQKDLYLKQWLKTKHAIMFRLNNKIFQVDFFDGSRVSLHTENKMVRIRSKKGQTTLTTLQEALSTKDSQSSRRIKYIRQILNKIKQK